jgi:hypothetical protein
MLLLPAYATAFAISPQGLISRAPWRNVRSDIGEAYAAFAHYQKRTSKLNPLARCARFQ